MTKPESPHAYDPVHNILYVYEAYGYRVLQFKMIHITNASLPAGDLNIPYSQTINITSNQGTSQTYSIVSGTLPAGLSLNSSTGVISGTPTATTTATFTIEADDNFSTGLFFDRATYSMAINGRITSFHFTNATYTSVIDQSSRTVTVYVPDGTSVTSLTPTIGLSSGATISPASGVIQNFTNPVIYTVTAQDGITQQTYTVSVKFNGAGGSGGSYAPAVTTPPTTTPVATVLPPSAPIQNQATEKPAEITQTQINNPGQIQLNTALEQIRLQLIAILKQLIQIFSAQLGSIQK
jgi:hypothetical protein